MQSYFGEYGRKHPLKLPPANKKGEDAKLNFVYRYLYGGPTIYLYRMRLDVI